jgi:hypothetical protein
MGDWTVIGAPGCDGLARHAGGAARVLADGRRPGKGAGE